MNRFEATVNTITLYEGVALIRVYSLDAAEMQIITLQPPKDIAIGASVTLLIGETKPTLLDSAASGFANTLGVKVQRIEYGKILSRVHLLLNETLFHLLMDTLTLQNMQLQEGQSLFVGLKATDISIEVNR
jgi:molybdopterin-binding protein